MNQDSLTAKSQEALQKAIELAHQNSHQAIENVHLLLGIEQVDQHLFPTSSMLVKVSLADSLKHSRLSIGRFRR